MSSTQASHPHHRPTLAEVAAIAGVSHQTVSRVINSYPGVRPATRDRVRAAIEQLGYRRNTAARSLATRESRLIGVIATGSFLYGPTSTLSSIERAARDNGYMALLATMKNAEETDLNLAVDQCLEYSVDILIIIANQEIWVRYADGLDLDIPVIVVGPRSANLNNLTCMSVDQTRGAEMAVEHLHSLGHRHIGLLAGPRDWVDAQQRLAGALDTCSRLRIDVDIFEGDWTGGEGHRVGMEVARMPRHERPTAVFAANDQMALGMLSAFHEAGVSVPGEISIIGFDDVPDARYYSPSLTTIRQDFETLGSRVITTSLNLLRGIGSEPGLVPPILTVRASTAAPPDFTQL